MSARRPHPAWNAILDEGETILWQGAPDGGFRFGAGGKALFLFGCAFAGFALFWMIMASLAGGYFWMFGLIHFAVGLGIMAGAGLGPTFVRRRTFYTLTDRRAFIARDLPLKGRLLDSYPITKNSVLSLHDKGDTGSIHFGKRKKRLKSGHRDVPVGFEDIGDAKAVYRMIRDVQKGAAL